MMSNQTVSSAFEEKAGTKKSVSEKDTPVEPGPAEHFLNITALIRSIQLAEGNIDCFRRAGRCCDQTDCSWRRCCLGTYRTSMEKGE